MPVEQRHLRLVASRCERVRSRCRSAACSLPSQDALGYCSPCEAVYLAARELRERLLERRGAPQQPPRPARGDGMQPDVRRRLLFHLAARSAHDGESAAVLDIAGLEDFLSELRELGLEGMT